MRGALQPAHRQATRRAFQHLSAGVERVIELTAIEGDARVIDKFLLAGVELGDGDFGHAFRISRPAPSASTLELNGLEIHPHRFFQARKSLGHHGIAGPFDQ